MYWTAASTPDGNGQMMLKKWQSVADHVQNIHEHDGDLYDACPHGPLEGTERHKNGLNQVIKSIISLLLKHNF